MKKVMFLMVAVMMVAVDVWGQQADSVFRADAVEDSLAGVFEEEDDEAAERAIWGFGERRDWLASWNFGVAVPTTQQTGLQLPSLYGPSGDKPHVGMKVTGGLDMNVEVMRRLMVNSETYLTATAGIIWMNQKSDVDSFSWTEDFVPPSLNVMSYLYMPVSLGLKQLWFSRDADEAFGWGVSAAMGVAYRNIRYGILEADEADDLRFDDRGWVPYLQVGIECQLLRFMSMGIYVRKLGNGTKGGDYYESWTTEDSRQVTVDRGLMRQTFVTVQWGVVF